MMRCTKERDAKVCNQSESQFLPCDDVQATHKESRGPSQELKSQVQHQVHILVTVITISPNDKHAHYILDFHHDWNDLSTTPTWQDKRDPSTKSKNIQQAGFPDGHPL
jgi:hypothetical protein